MLVLLLAIVILTNLSSEISARHPKFWPIGLVRFENGLCTSVEGYQGTCYTKRQCANIDGTGTSRCANGLGTCCIFQSSCGTTSANNNTYFVNSGFPGTQTGGSQCTITIRKCSSDICQVRLDFLNLILAQPDGNGNCISDSLVITGGASNVPTICGVNSGQHVYVNFNGAADIKIVISTSSAVSLGRSWNIKVAQLACDCPSLAPLGCLMYHRGLTGTVFSFNYGTTLSGANIDIGNAMMRPGTREIANLNYGVCVDMLPGYCSIQWSQGSDATSFTVTGNTALAEAAMALPGGSLKGENCTTDFVVVPNPSYPNGTMVNTDRFCGNQFPTIITSSKMFVLTVVTNGDDLTDVANRGFTLNYQQLPCSTNPLIN